MTVFLFEMSAMYAHCSFLSVGLPADFLDWLGYQLIFFIRWDCAFLPVGLPADFHNHFLFLTSVVIDLPWPYFFF